RLPAQETHRVRLAATVHLHVQPRGQRIDHRGAHAVQATGRGIGAAAELPAGVQFGVDHFHTGQAHAVHRVHRDTPAVVAHLHGHVRVQDDLDRVAVPLQGFVDGVVDDLPQAVHQSPGVRGTDVHAGAFAHRLETFEHRQVPGGVAVLHGL